MKKLISVLAVFAAIGTLPMLVTSDFWLNISIMVLYSALLGQAWNMLGGFAGQFSFGNAAYFGTGAYTVSILQVSFGVSPWIGLIAGSALAALVAVLIGLTTFRFGLRGAYFALVTLAIAEVFRIVASSSDITGKGVGILIPLSKSAADFQFTSRVGFFWVIWAMALGAFLVVWWICNSRFGAQLTAIRDNEDGARALGVDVFRVKLGAIALSGAFAGLAGVFYAQYNLFIDPQIAYGAATSVESLVVAIIGGTGTLFGPLLGAAMLRILGEASRELIGDIPGVSLALYGVLLVVTVVFLPRGLAGLRLGRKRRSGQVDATLKAGANA